MPRPIRSRPGRAALVILLLVLGILATYDLSTPDSGLKALWQNLFPGQSRGEELRDNVIDVLTPRN